MVIGGGIIRDAIMGGVPVDIDVWLPSNVAQNSHDIYDFSRVITDAFPGIRVQHVFEGPRELNPANDPNNYRDMSNHWVVEFDVGTVKFNVMRTMTQWTGDSAAFFGSVMQNFDIDLCMMFTGAIPTGRGFFTEPVTNIILPSNIVENLQDGRAIDTFCWNRFRYEQTNVARRNFRRDKIMSRYGVQEGVVLERAQFIPTPVELTFVLEAQSLLPFPQPPEMADLRTTREAEAQGFASVNDLQTWEATPRVEDDTLSARIRSLDNRIQDLRIRQRGLVMGDNTWRVLQDLLTQSLRQRADLRNERDRARAQDRLGRITAEYTRRTVGRGAVPPINIPASWGVPPPPPPVDLVPDPARPGMWIDPVLLRERERRDRDLALLQLQRQQEAQWMAAAQGGLGQMEAMTAEQYRQRVTNNFFATATPRTAEALAGLVQRARAGQDTAQRATLNGDLNGAAIHDETFMVFDEAQDLTIGAEMAQNRTPENF